jgi:hypothetical protein
MRWTASLAVALAVACALPVWAQDKTLSEGHPVRLGDAFPIASGEGALLVATGVSVPRRGHPRALFPVELQYGVFTRTQLSVGTALSSHPHEADDPRAGDLDVSVRVNFGRQTTLWPTLAALIGVTFPTGVDSTTYGVVLKGYATKTVNQEIFLHLNAEEDVSDRARAGDRQARYRLALGASYVVPTLASLMLVGDVFADQAARVRDPSTVGVEIGVRYRVSPAVYWDAGVGTALAGPGDRDRFFFTTGFTVGFDVGR